MDRQLHPPKCRQMSVHFPDGSAFHSFFRLMIFSILQDDRCSPTYLVLTVFFVPAGVLYLECAGRVFSACVTHCFRALETASELQGFLSGAKVLSWNRPVERGEWDG